MLYFCGLSIPACIRTTVSGPYPKRQLVFQPATPPTFESCVNLFIWAFTWHVKHQQVIRINSTESQLSKPPNSPLPPSPTPSCSSHLAPSDRLGPSPPWRFPDFLPLHRHSSCRAPARAPPNDQVRCQWHVWQPGSEWEISWRLSPDWNMKLYTVNENNIK